MTTVRRRLGRLDLDLRSLAVRSLVFMVISQMERVFRLPVMSTSRRHRVKTDRNRVNSPATVYKRRRRRSAREPSLPDAGIIHTIPWFALASRSSGSSGRDRRPIDHPADKSCPDVCPPRTPAAPRTRNTALDRGSRSDRPRYTMNATDWSTSLTLSLTVTCDLDFRSSMRFSHDAYRRTCKNQRQR